MRNNSSAGHGAGQSAVGGPSRVWDQVASRDPFPPQPFCESVRVCVGGLNFIIAPQICHGWLKSWINMSWERILQSVESSPVPIRLIPCWPQALLRNKSCLPARDTWLHCLLIAKNAAGFGLIWQPCGWLCYIYVLIVWIMTISPGFVLLWTAICFQRVTIFLYIWTSYKYLAASIFCNTNTAESHWYAGQSVISRGLILMQLRYGTGKYGSLSQQSGVGLSLL